MQIIYIDLSSDVSLEDLWATWSNLEWSLENLQKYAI